MHVEQQREVLSRQQDTLNLLAPLVTTPQAASCFWSKQHGHLHFVCDCPKPPPTYTQGDRHQAAKKMSVNEKTELL